MKNEPKVWSQAALNFCQSALPKFHFGTPSSSGVVFALTAVKTTGWSLPKNSFLTVEVQREEHELETSTKSNRLHALRPVNERWVGVLVFNTTKSCTSRASTKYLPMQLLYTLPYIPWWPLKSPQRITLATLDKKSREARVRGLEGGCKC